MLALAQSRHFLLLAGAFSLAIAARVYLSNGGAEAMVYRPPSGSDLHDAEAIIGAVVLAAAVSGAVAAAGKRWFGPISATALGGIGGLLAISLYNAVLGALIGLAVGALVACNAFGRPLAGLAKSGAALAAGILSGAAALATNRDLGDGPGAIVMLLMGLTALAAGLILFRRSQEPPPANRKALWKWRLGRTCLFSLVIAGLWLSLSVDSLRRANRLARAGFPLILDSLSLSPELPWLWRGCVNVAHLSAHTDLTDDALSDLRGFVELETLDLRHTQITDKGLAQLASLPRLNFLVLNQTGTTGDGFNRLGGLRTLRVVFLDGSQVNDQGLRQIGALPALGSLHLSGTRVGDEGLRNLKGLTSLSELDLSGTQVTDEGLPALGSLKWLRTLDLSDTQITDAGLESLPALPRLTNLRLDKTRITDSGLSHLQRLPLLFYVNVQQTSVTDEGAKSFSKTMRLRATGQGCKIER